MHTKKDTQQEYALLDIFIMYSFVSSFFFSFYFVVRQKLIVEYDENGNIIDTDEEDNDEEAGEEEVIELPNLPSVSTTNASNGKRKEPLSIKRRIVMKKKHVFKKPATGRTVAKLKHQSNAVTTKDIINYAMDQMRITDNNGINLSSKKLIDVSIIFVLLTLYIYLRISRTSMCVHTNVAAHHTNTFMAKFTRTTTATKHCK